MAGLRPSVLLVLATLFWSLNVVLGRWLRGLVPPEAITFWRWAIALCILVPLEGRRLWRARAVLAGRWPFLLLLGFLGCFLYQALSYRALVETTALNALVVSASSPLVVALLGWALHRERVTLRLAGGILLSTAGVLVVVTRADPAALAALELGRGDLLMLAAVVVWALYSLLLRRRPPELTPLGLVTTTAAAGILFAAPAYAAVAAAGARVVVTAGTVAALAYIGIFPSVLAYLFWNEGVARAGAGRAGLSMNLMPVFGAVLAVLLLGETLALHHAVGASLVAAGVAVGGSGATSPGAPRERGPTPPKR